MKKRYFLLPVFIMLHAFAAQAQLDPSFGNGGIVITPADNVQNGFSNIHAVAIQVDGKIIAGGEAVGGRFLARYKTNGSLDTSFAGIGYFVDTFQYNIPAAIAVQTDGKILSAGTAFNSTPYNSFLSRTLANGKIDSSFGNNGTVFCYQEIYSMALQLDGKIILAGNTSGGGLSVYRFHTSGQPDSSFGVNGYVYTNFSPGSFGGSLRAVAVQPDGKILVAGDNDIQATNQTAFIVVRYNTDGSLDTLFNHSGKVYTYVGSGWNVFGRSLNLQPDGKILVSGTGGQGMVYVRYHTDGSLDTTFDHTGIYSTLGNDHEVEQTELMPDGRFISAGYDDTGRYTVHRFLPYGAVDSSFGINGVVKTIIDTCSNTYQAYAVKYLPNSKILLGGAGGVCTYPNGGQATLVQYLPNAHTGIYNLPQTKQLQLYPNPAREQLHIVLPDAYSGTLYLIDIAGHMLHAQTFNNTTSLTLPVQALPSGAYFITIKTTEDQLLHARFVKN